MDLTFRARTKPYGLRRGSMRIDDDVVWDQCHMFQSGIYEGTYTANGVTREVREWWGQRDHSWGVRDHGRCPLWLWFQVQLPDGFFGVWHWELTNGARVYTDADAWSAEVAVALEGLEVSPLAPIVFVLDVLHPAGETPPIAFAPAKGDAPKDWQRLVATWPESTASFLTPDEDRRRALENVVWAILNSKEFQLNQ